MERSGVSQFELKHLPAGTVFGENDSAVRINAGDGGGRLFRKRHDGAGAHAIDAQRQETKKCDTIPHRPQGQMPVTIRMVMLKLHLRPPIRDLGTSGEPCSRPWNASCWSCSGPVIGLKFPL